METIIEKIRKEIERMRKEMDNDTLLASNQQAGYLFALAEIQGFLNSLQEETCKESLHIPETCKENQDSLTLEEAAEKFVGYDMDCDELRDHEVGIAAFIAGAEWQARQPLQGAPMPEDTVLFNRGVAEGRRLEREDMMKEAVEGEVGYWNQRGLSILLDKSLEKLGYDENTKVKLIIVKDK